MGKMINGKYTYSENTQETLDTMIGKTLISIEGAIAGKDHIKFTADDGSIWEMEHNQDCCERVDIDDVIGDINDIIGSPILKATEDTSCTNIREQSYPDDSFTWTFYNIATVKGNVTIKWYGASNGYYSESVDLYKMT